MRKFLPATLTLVFAYSSGVDATHLKPDPRMTPAEVSFVSAEGPGKPQEVFVDGFIHRATVEAFRRRGFLNGQKLGYVTFNSHGGDLLAAMELGVLIRERGFSTRIGVAPELRTTSTSSYCESACPFAYAGGVFRLMDSGSRMGVHQFFKPSGSVAATDIATGQVTSTLLANHLSNLSIDLRLLEVAATAGPEQMNYLDPFQAYELDLVNAGSLSSTWNLKAEKGLVYLLAEQTKIAGTGRIVLSCSSGNRVSMAVFYNAWYDPGTISAMDEFSLLIDGQPYKTHPNRLGKRLVNGFSYLTFDPSPDQIQAFRKAKTVGFSFLRAGSPATKASFTIDVNDGNGMISSFEQFCAGSRPAFEDKI